MLHRTPFIIAVAGMLGGVLIAILFGANESMFEQAIHRGLARNPAVTRIADVNQRNAVIKKEAEKSWRYYQRFHFHANGIGAMSVALLLLLSFMEGARLLRLAAAYLISVGGALYPFVWLFAALYGPELGRAVAKERFAIFGYMGGLFLLGVLAVLGLLVSRPLRFSHGNMGNPSDR